ncbi:MAG: host attachment protein [Thiobacillaceae bacterium]|nr:host attachment protein [Thiobacillaceae bacterium]MCX7673750.1 host attachment protein [Thiobacillaceae bacterium]MDW8323316.1 host attachment protein [Burkholderiales bacterium]
MSVTWILVANASHAKLYANHGPKKGLELVKELDHPESREKAANLVSDRNGNYQGSGSYTPPTSPKEHEAEVFAQEVARVLEEGRVNRAYDRLILVASAHFMGLLNQRLSQHVRNLVSDTLEKDYTRLPVKELAGHLQDYVYV